MKLSSSFIFFFTCMTESTFRFCITGAASVGRPVSLKEKHFTKTYCWVTNKVAILKVCGHQLEAQTNTDFNKKNIYLQRRNMQFCLLRSLAYLLLTQELLSISSVPCEDVDLVSSDCPFKFVFLGFPLRPLLFPLGGEGSNSCSLILSSKSALGVRKHHQITFSKILRKTKPKTRKNLYFLYFSEIKQSEIKMVAFSHLLQPCKFLKTFVGCILSEGEYIYLRPYFGPESSSCKKG